MKILIILLLTLIASTNTNAISSRSRLSELINSRNIQNPKKQLLGDPLEWQFNDCSSFSQMDVVKVLFSNEPTVNLEFNFTIVGKANMDVNFTMIKFGVYESLVPAGSVPDLFRVSAKKGQTFQYQSVFLDFPQGHIGLWTFFIQFWGNNNKYGCLNFDIYTKLKKPSSLSSYLQSE